jgi:SAM-dependent methyltransferase
VTRDEPTILEINSLWLPVYPFMVDHLLDRSGVASGRFLDLGPFAGGLALNLLWKTERFLATVADESEAVLRWVEERAAEGGYVSRLATRRARPERVPEPDASFDLVAVRGAFFFLTPTLLREAYRLLRPGGFAWIGGGYGPATPEAVIASIAERSKLLNDSLGKRRISPAEAAAMLEEAQLDRAGRVAEEGGLWIELRA